MSQPVVVANLCKSCLKDCDLDESFCTEVADGLALSRPEIQWSVGTITCQRFCPEGRLTLSVKLPEASDPQLGMTRSASLEDTVRAILVRTSDVK